MKLTIYGTASCANCKAFLSMAKARGFDPSYVLIDSDPALYDQFREIADLNYGVGSPVSLPLVVLEADQVGAVTAGLQGGLSTLTLAQSIKEDQK